MDFRHLQSELEVLAYIEWHNANSEYAVLDFETTDLDPTKAELVDIQMSGMHPDEAVLFDGKFLPLLKQLRVRQVGQNWIRYDWKVALKHGVDLRTENVRDTMLMHHLVDENADHSLDAWVQENYQDDFKEQFWKKYDSYLAAPFSERFEYGLKDVIYTRRFYESLLVRLKTECIPEELVEQTHRLAHSLVDTEIRGIRVDLDYTVSMGTELKGDIVRTERELRNLGGAHCESVELDLWLKELGKRKTEKGKANVAKPEFSFSSPSQLSALLYQELKLPVQYNVKTKKPSTDKGALDALEFKHPLIPKLMEYRKMTTMFGTFVDGVLQRAVGDRIYPEFKVTGTKTQRISHADPNMGNMPSKGDWVKIRGIFVPDEGNALGSADYGQLEVCIAAHYSQDKSLLKILNEGASQHDITAEGLGVPRETAKTLNFALQYLAGPDKVADILGVSKAEGLNAWRKYWETYSGLKQFIDQTIAEMETQGYVTTLFGSRRRFPGYQRPKWCDPEKGKYCKPMRQAFNARIQGTGGVMMSYAFSRTDAELKRRGIGYGWFTVHDEGLIETRKNRFQEGMDLLVSNMLAVGPEVGLRVPLKVAASDALSRWQK